MAAPKFEVVSVDAKPDTEKERGFKVTRKGQKLPVPSGRMKPDVNLRQVSRLTEAGRKGRASEVVVHVFRVENGVDNIGVYKIVYAYTLHNRINHISAIAFYHSPVPSKAADLANIKKSEIPTYTDLWNKPVWVSCNCEDFGYKCEVALHKFGATDILYSDGSFPQETNPKMIPMACKHIYAMAPLAVKARSKHAKPRSAPEHPAHTGKLPDRIKREIGMSAHMPTVEEVSSAMLTVRNFL